MGGPDLVVVGMTLNLTRNMLKFAIICHVREIMGLYYIVNDFFDEHVPHTILHRFAVSKSSMLYIDCLADADFAAVQHA